MLPGGRRQFCADTKRHGCLSVRAGACQILPSCRYSVMLRFAVCCPPSQSWLHFCVIQRFGSIWRYLYSDKVCDSHLRPGMFQLVYLPYFQEIYLPFFLLATAASDPRAEEFSVTTTGFAPTSTSVTARQLMPMNITSQGCPRSSWPCKTRLSDPMAKGNTLCLLKLLGTSAP